jgi:hypothetical protein
MFAKESMGNCVRELADARNSQLMQKFSFSQKFEDP